MMKRLILLLTIMCCLSIASCSDKLERPILLKPAHLELWQASAQYTFLSDQGREHIALFVAYTEALLAQANGHEQTEHPLLTNDILSTYVSNIKNKAQWSDNANKTRLNDAELDRERTFTRLYLAFMMTSINTVDPKFQQQKERFSQESSDSYKDNLAALSLAFGDFSAAQMQWYFIDEESQVMAFQRISEDKRAYIAFSFSFDNQQMPFPFGFMNSTKMSVWHDKSSTINTFVSNGALSLPSLSVMVVIVD